MINGGITLRELGIVVLNMEQERDYFNQLGIHSQKYDFNLYLFTPDAINFTTKNVTGKKYSSENTWTDEIFKLPEFIYDRCFYPSLKFRMQYLPLIQSLKQILSSTFIGHGLPGKLAVYHALSEEPKLHNYLPITEQLTTIKQIHEYLHIYPEIIIKPIFGSQGKEIQKIKISENHIQTSTNGIKNIIFDNQEQFEEWISSYIQKGTYIIQPYLSLQVDDQPFDIRILLQKDGKGKWVEQGRGIRVGMTSTLISNLHAGGEVFEYNSWMNKKFKEKRLEIDQSVDQLVKILPRILEKNYPPLFELGIDIGVDQVGHVWILEANSKPGYQVLETLKNHRMYEAPLLYCLYLTSSRETLAE